MNLKDSARKYAALLFHSSSFTQLVTVDPSRKWTIPMNFDAGNMKI